MRIAAALSWIALMGAALVILVVRFQHAELTETQLFMRVWPLALVAMLGAAGIARTRAR